MRKLYDLRFVRVNEQAQSGGPLRDFGQQVMQPCLVRVNDIYVVHVAPVGTAPPYGLAEHVNGRGIEHTRDLRYRRTDTEAPAQGAGGRRVRSAAMPSEVGQHVKRLVIGGHFFRAQADSMRRED